MSEGRLTIGRLAKAAEVGIETIRYYQRLNLLPIPKPQGNQTFRHYPLDLVNRIRFIKQAQTLGFSLDEIATLLSLNDGLNRKAIREVATDKLENIRIKISGLQRLESVLESLILECRGTEQTKSCPIISTLELTSIDVGQLKKCAVATCE